MEDQGWHRQERPPRTELGRVRRALKPLERLVYDHPAVTDSRSTLEAVHSDLFLVFSHAGQPAAAEARFRHAREIRRKLAEGHPTESGYRDDLAMCQTDFSIVLRHLCRPTEAREICAQAITVFKALVLEVPMSSRYLKRLAHNCRYRGLVRRDLGDAAGTTDDARRAIRLWDGVASRAGEDWFDTASAHATLAILAGRADSGVSAEQAQAEADTAMALLHKAVAMGYRSTSAYRTEDALDPLRDREDFRLLMMDLAMPADVYARAH
jgi:hypothetical protein